MIAWVLQPMPSDTFPHYYADNYSPTLAAMCREILRLRGAAHAS